MPPRVVTRTLAGPAVVVVGVLHVRLVALVTLNVLQALPRTATAVAPVKLVPVTVMIVPPASGPELGDTSVTVDGATKVYRVLAVLVPPGLVTRTLALPAVPAGTVQVMLVALATLKLLHAVPPTVTAVAPVRLVPVMLMLVPPAVGPALGDTPVTVGGVTKLYRVLAVLVPPGLVTRTLAVPAVLAGVVQVALVSLVTLWLVHALPPMVTAVAPVKPVPVRVMVLPPVVLPELGEMALTVGTPAYL